MENQMHDSGKRSAEGETVTDKKRAYTCNVCGVDDTPENPVYRTSVDLPGMYGVPYWMCEKCKKQKLNAENNPELMGRVVGACTDLLKGISNDPHAK